MFLAFEGTDEGYIETSPFLCISFFSKAEYINETKNPSLYIQELFSCKCVNI